MTYSQKNKLKRICKPLISPFFPLHSRIHKMQKENFYVKRDDELGFGVSGSKLRKYVSILPFLEKTIKDVALIGSPYSNHVLSLAQLLKQHNIPYQLFLEKPQTSDCKGNFFFLSLLTDKKDVIWIDKVPDSLTASWTKSWEKKLQKEFLWIPIGGCMREGLPGALTLPLDILENEKTMKSTFTDIFIDAGTGLTAIGLILGLHYLQKKTKVHVVLIAGEEEEFNNKLLTFHAYLEELLKETISKPTNYSLIKPITSKSFGSCNATILKLIVETARKEGFFLDALYNAKLMLTALDTAKKEKIEGNKLWIHSGGALSLSGFQEILSPYL